MTDYHCLQAHYEACFRRHGDSHLGVDWPKEADVSVRHAVMLDLVPRGEKATLLDFGCGLGHLLPAAEARGLDYRGLDISPLFIEACRKKFPGRNFQAVDILAERAVIAPVDYGIANGVFTEKRELSQGAMETFLSRTLRKLFAACRTGLAFNVMSTQVDYQRDDLFHVSFDWLARLIQAELAPHFVFRSDYGLREYTAYVTRAPSRGYSQG